MMHRVSWSRYLVTAVIATIALSPGTAWSFSMPPGLAVEVVEKTYQVDGRKVDEGQALSHPCTVRSWAWFHRSPQGRDADARLVLALEQSFGPGAVAIRSERGVHATLYRRDRRDGQTTEEVFLDEAFRPCADRDGIALVRFRYDRRGALSEKAYFALSGEKAANASGIHRVTFDGGGTEAWACFGLRGEPRANSEGVHRVRFDTTRQCLVRYDLSGHEVVTATREVVDPATGAITVKSLDSNGNVLDERVLDPGRRPAAGPAGWHRMTQTYSRTNLWTSRAFFDPEGRPWSDSKGVARRERTFDEKTATRLESEAFFGADGRPCVNEDGVHRVLHDHDANGRETRRANFDVHGQPCADARGVHRIVLEHHPRSLKSTSYEGVDGEAVPGPDGWCTATYDRRGKPTYAYPPKPRADKQYPVDVWSCKGQAPVYVVLSFVDQMGKVVTTGLAGDVQVRDKRTGSSVAKEHRHWLRAGSYTVRARTPKGLEREQPLTVTAGAGVRATLRFDWTKP